MIVLKDLDQKLQDILKELTTHPKVITIGVGAKAVIVYVSGKQTQKTVESRIPEEYRPQVQVVLTSRPKPAKKRAK